MRKPVSIQCGDEGKGNCLCSIGDDQSGPLEREDYTASLFCLNLHINLSFGVIR